MVARQIIFVSIAALALVVGLHFGRLIAQLLLLRLPVSMQMATLCQFSTIQLEAQAGLLLIMFMLPGVMGKAPSLQQYIFIT